MRRNLCLSLHKVVVMKHGRKQVKVVVIGDTFRDICDVRVEAMKEKGSLTLWLSLMTGEDRFNEDEHDLSHTGVHRGNSLLDLAFQLHQGYVTLLHGLLLCHPYTATDVQHFLRLMTMKLHCTHHLPFMAIILANLHDPVL
ncbi:hypothetical protein VNO77_15420 [Canavalia gladiata]|uniref:Uncharacterized protein n=1 Tax=Canavalia gladiata TaxID=3824 RepID=A0AAN9LZI3_CANGL